MHIKRDKVDFMPPTICTCGPWVEAELKHDKQPHGKPKLTQRFFLALIIPNII